MVSEIAMRCALLISESRHQDWHRSMSLATTQKCSKILALHSCLGDQAVAHQKVY